MARLRMGAGILRRKPIEHFEETEVSEGPRLDRSPGLWQLTAIGVGGIIGAGTGGLGVSPRQAQHPRRHGGQRDGGARRAGLVPHRRSGERLRRAVVRRVRRADPEGGVGVHVRLCGARRVRGLVHRLGPAAGVHGDRGGGRDRHLGVLRLPGRGDGREPAALDARRAGHRVRPPGRPVRRDPLSADRLPAQPRHPQRGPLRDDRGGAQGAGGTAGDRCRRLPHQFGELPPLLPVRRQRCVHRGGDRVLRRLRVRRDVDGGRGVEGRAAALAEGDHLLAGDLDGAVRGCLSGPDGHAGLQGDRPGERFLDGVQVGGAERSCGRDRGGRDHPG